MDFPFGHNRSNHHQHQHQNRRDYEDVEEDYPPPPPPNFHNQPPPTFPGGFRDEQPPPPPPPHPNFYNNQPPPTFPGGFRDEQQQPPPPPFSTHHQHRPNYYGEEEIGGYQQPPPQPQPHHYQGVQHVSHHSDDRPHNYGGGGDHNTNTNSNHLPSFIHHHQHTSTPAASGPEMINKPTVRVYSKADTGYSLTIRDSQVVLVPSDPRDQFQHWFKDQKFSTRVKDEEGFPCFALVNKATGQAIKHSIAATQPVQLVPYNPNAFDESVLWTESKDLGDSYRCIRMVNNIRLNLDAFNGDKNHGGVHDGTIAVLWEWKKGDNQRWKIAPYCKFHRFE